MLRSLIPSIAVVCTIVSQGSSFQSCPPASCGTVACTSTCIVTCQSELLSALACKAAGSGCNTIEIQNSVTIDLCTTLEITSSHNGLNLIIDGTLRWIGTTGTSQTNIPRMIELTGASNITIEGSGTITSIYVPCVVWDGSYNCSSPSNGVALIANAIFLDGGANSNITIQDLTFENLASAVFMSAGGGTNINMANLTATQFTQYGVYGEGTGLTIDNCDVNAAVPAQHGFRTYANNVTILHSSATNTGTGFWMVTGDNLKADDFYSDGQRTQVGPDHGSGEIADRARNVDIQNITITGFSANDKMQFNVGTIGAWFDNITNQVTNTLGLGPVNSERERPSNKIFWGTLSGTASLSHSCVGPDTGQRGCQYDITNDDAVGVPALLAVINAWGACTMVTLCSNDQFNEYNCLEDVSPFYGDGTVGVPDLLAIINNWGSCTSSTRGQLSGPEQYCIDYATEVLELEPYSEDWNNAVKECMSNL